MDVKATGDDLTSGIETALSVGRIGLGIALLLAPGAMARGWVGEDAQRPAVRAAVRGLAGRDVALGLGALLARRHGQSTRGWLEAAALADLGDAIATLLSWRHLPARGRRMVLVMAGGAAVVDAYLARAPAETT